MAEIWQKFWMKQARKLRRMESPAELGLLLLADGGEPPCAHLPEAGDAFARIAAGEFYGIFAKTIEAIGEARHRAEKARSAGRHLPKKLYQALYRPTEVSLQFSSSAGYALRTHKTNLL
jgi:hypothetical protein